MPRLHSPAAPGYAGTVASNTFWNVLQSLATSLTGLAVSILTARYLGSNDFGVLSYVIWLTSMVAMVSDLGMDQVLRKYVPAWFHQSEMRGWALGAVGRAIAIQLAVAGVLIAGLVVSFPWWSRSLTIAHPRLGLVMAIGLVSVLPVVVSRCVATFLRSIQNTRALAQVNLASQTANLALVGLAVAFRFPLEALVAAGLITQILLAAGLMVTMRRQYTPGGGADPAGAWPGEVTRYALISYANVLLQQVVWSRSETFFLGIYSPAREVGFYGLAYSIAGMIAGMIGVSQQALYAAQFRALAANELARSDRFASLSIKYLGIAFLPACLACWLFMDSIVRLLYGSDYEMVARIFPFVLFGTAVATLLNPVATKLHLSNRKLAATLGIGVAGAVINIALDLLLIPSRHAWGAAVANSLSQIMVVAIGMTFVARVSPVRLDLRALAVVAVVNLMMAALVWLVLSRANVFALKLVLAAVLAALYLRWLAFWGAIDDGDRALLTALEAGAPRWLRPMFRLVRTGLGAAAA